MKKLIPVAFLLVALAGCGVPSEVKRQAPLNAARAARMLELHKAGQATEAQAWEFIAADADAWRAFCDALGVKGGA